MSPGFIADSSIGISWVISNQSTAATERLLAEVEAGTPFVIPVLWTFEVANTLLMLMRRRRITQEECGRGLRAISRLAPVMDDEGPRLALHRIAELAPRHDLTVYDATYLELAIRRGLPLASRDTALNRAARACGVKTLV